MTKKILFLLFAACWLFHVSAAFAQEPIRVKCSRFTMNVPSSNVKCYQTDTNIPIEEPEDEDVPDDFEDEDAIPEREATDPGLLAGAQIANTAIVFSDYENLSPAISPQVTFYLSEDMGKTAFSLFNLALSVNNIMNSVNSDYLTVEEAYPELPFMPFQALPRLVNCLPQKIEFDNGTGIRTIAAFQDPIVASIAGSNLYYSFQGMSSDGAYYISAVFPLKSSSLNGMPVADIDWNSISGDDFQPSLSELDYYVRSIVIE